jgi:pSer/pThr/pTyr-binding forkhead associated (FHA) protein
MNKDETSSNELRVALQKAERKLAEREILINAAIEQTATARSQYEQANERAETLRRRLDANEEQLNTLQSQVNATSVELALSRDTISSQERRIDSLQQELKQRDERIATLKQLYEENDSALHAINLDAKRQNLKVPSGGIDIVGMALESLDGLDIHHKLNGGVTTLGRSSGNDILIDSVSVSRYHARIVIDSEGVTLIDLQSTNGCSVNGRRVSRQAITDRDVVSIGDAKFKLVTSARADIEDRSMDETHAMLDDADIFSPARKAKSSSVHGNDANTKSKLGAT